jgi:uncharacterized protein (DUF1330 family)
VPAYLVADVDVTDPEAYAEYVENVPATIEAYGGRYLARAGETEVLEGDWRPSRFVIVEFPSVERALEWYWSAEYEPVRAIRIANAESRLVLTEGLGD